MTEQDLPIGVRAFILTVRGFGGEVSIDYDRQSIGIHFNDPKDEKKFYSWIEYAAEVGTVVELEGHSIH